MNRRPLSPVERMVDVFDRASTLSFTVVATLRGALDAAQLEQALRKLERRHPLLRARVERTPRQLAFVLGEAAPIALRIVDDPATALWELAQASLDHRLWSDEGPRAELTWLRHAPDHASLLLCLHHLVSDGSSGIFAMRDLLRLLAEPHVEPEPLLVPPQSGFYPPGHGSLRWKLRAGAFVAHALLGQAPLRLRAEPRDPSAPRNVRLAPLRLDVRQMQALMQRARADGATVHGVLSAAVARGLWDAAEAAGGRAKAPQSILHAVDLRRYLRACYPGTDIPDAVGYYVSSVGTQHRYAASGPLGPLARAISEAVRAKKAEGEPLLSAPIAGSWIAQRARASGELRGFRDFLERRILLDSFAITNLGPLERLGVEQRVGELYLEELFFVAAGSVFTALLASASTLGGALSMPIGWVEPLVARELGERVVARAKAELHEYAAGVLKD